MSIEQAIHQKEFKDLYEKAIVNVLYTASWISYRQSMLFKSHGITMQQYNILRILKGQSPEPITVNQLIERMIDKSSNASRIVERLRLKGLLKREVCPEDRRRVDIFITDKGEKVLIAATEELKQMHTKSRKLNGEEVGRLNALLDKLRGENENTEH